MNEQDLFELKWFDYRLMAPDIATLAFITQYGEAKRYFLEMRGHGKFVNVFKNLDVANFREWRPFGTFTKLRQIADKNFCRYSDFWVYAWHGHDELKFNNKHEGIFLYPKLLNYTLDRCRVYASECLRYAKHWFFEPEHYMALDLQKDYYSWLAAEVNYKPERLETMVADGKMSQIFLDTNLSNFLIRKGD